MSDNRMIDIAEKPAKLNIRNKLLIIKTGEEESIPLKDIAVIVVSHPQVVFTHAVLTRLAASGAMFVTCDDQHMPASMLLPLDAHFLQADRFEKQAAVPLPARKRIWQAVVRAKIKAQSGLLIKLYGDDKSLTALISRVRSGDPQNIEARAAQRYWQLLFADKHFRRNRDAEDQNRFLNYGYMILRAVIARAVCAAGLHPSLGLHHHNQYNAFCLADDIMEPFRPLVDNTVVAITNTFGNEAPINKETKSILLNTFTRRFVVWGEARTIFDIAAKTAQNLAGIYLGEKKELILPDWDYEPE